MQCCRPVCLLAAVGLWLFPALGRSAPWQLVGSDNICLRGAARLMYVDDSVVMEARFTAQGLANSTRQRACAIDLVTCIHCHLQLTVLPGHLDGCPHLDQCRCHLLEFTELGQQYKHDVSECNIDRLFSVTSIGRTLNVRLSFAETLMGRIRFKAVAKENHFVYTDPAAVVETARFPASYPANYVAEYVIRRPQSDKTSAILLSFTDFFVSPWSLLEVLDSKDHKIATYTGDIFRPPVSITNTTQLTLRFHANGRPGAGFRAKYSLIAPSVTGAALFPPRTSCGGVVVSPGGAITMLNMTASGQVWYDCIWLIRARLPAGQAGKLSLRLNVFRNFAPGSQLKIVAGQTTRDATVALISGTAIGHNETSEHLVDSDQAFYVHLQAGFTAVSQLALVYSSFRRGACGFHQEMACGDGRCIASFLRCDGFAHCPDRSDEADSCYTYSLSSSLGLRNDDSWTLSPPNFYFPSPSHSMSSLESATLALLALCLIIVLTMTSAVIFIYSNGRAAERRTNNRILQSISSLIRESSIEVVTASSDEPPDYEPPPDYEEVVHCFTLQKKRKKKINKKRKAVDLSHTRLPNLRMQLSTELNSLALFASSRRLPRNNTIPSLHQFGDWLRHHGHSRPRSTSPTGCPGTSSQQPTEAALKVALTTEQHDVQAQSRVLLPAGPAACNPECEHGHCPGACSCSGGSSAMFPLWRPRQSLPRSKSADMLSTMSNSPRATALIDGTVTDSASGRGGRGGDSDSDGAAGEEWEAVDGGDSGLVGTTNEMPGLGPEAIEGMVQNISPPLLRE